MNKFERKVLHKVSIPVSDNGIKVSELVSLIKENYLSRDIFKFLEIDEILNDFININGAKTLYNTQVILNERFYKEDLQSSIDNITFYNKDKFSINFSDTSNSKYFKDIKVSSVCTYPIYSATRDFFSSLYNMDKYASRLIETGNKHIVEANLELLKDVVEKNDKRYRILHDKVENEFYLRAIISLTNYNNYDNNVAIVIGLLTLHNEMKKSNLTYSLKRCEYNESFIRMFFESSEIKKLESIGTVKNIVEVSNDEIKREALRFTGVCLIEFGNKNKKTDEIFIRPQETKSRILSVKHNQSTVNAIRELGNIENTKKIHEELYDDILTITTITKPEQIKYLVQKKIENAKSDEVRRIKIPLLKELSNKVDNIIQLLTVFRKIELLANEDIEAVEYIRFIIYQALIERK
jgi:hypothetical protein